MVSQSSGDTAVINKLKSGKSGNNLGLITRLDGYCSNIMEVLTERLKDWTFRVKTKGLLTRLV